VLQPSPLSKRHRFPGEIISHAVWLYFRFLLSYRDVEELLAERGIAVSYETVRRWCRKFGPTFADGLRRRRPRPGNKWHSAAKWAQSSSQGNRSVFNRSTSPSGH
jgi:putative transposase